MTRMPGRIKPEPHPQVSQPSPTLTLPRSTPPMDSSASNQLPERRLARSGAPSVDTSIMARRAPGLRSAHGYGDDSTTDDPILMQVRPVKKQADDDDTDSRMDAPLPQNVSFVSHGFTAIGDKVKELNDTLGELQSLGIQHVTSLPELVLVGDQSAGKSSLMSAFSGIYLPRSEGVCTKCPVHIRLSQTQSSPWSCRISLQQDYDYRPPANVTKAHPFGPWFDRPRTVKDFAIFGNPADIELGVRWAQVATLNPNRDAELYKQSIGGNGLRLEDAEASTEAPFSPNTVAIDISGPGLPDLSFYDLPGVFKAARHDDEQYLVKVVENLAAKYISHKRAIILWAVPMNSDPENSSTFSLIRDQKAQARTIGILTKADLLPPGNHSQWIAMLQGEQHRVGHGYFITARPTVTRDSVPEEMVQQQKPSQQGSDLLRQGAYEEAFFNRNIKPDWPQAFAPFSDRCGVSHLTAFMSHQLGEEFAKSLPEIKEKVSLKLMEVTRELSRLPDLPPNPEIEVRRSLMNFQKEVEKALESKPLSSELGRIANEFRLEIINLKPRFNVAPDPPLRVLADGSIDLTKDDDAASMRSSTPFTPDIKRRNLADFFEGQRQVGQNPVTPSKRHCSGNGIKAEEGLEYNFHPRSFTPAHHGPKPRSKKLSDIRAVIASKSNPGLPGLVSPEVHESLALEAVAVWYEPLRRLLEKTFQLLDDVMGRILDDTFCNLKERLVYKNSASYVKKLLVDEVSRVREVLQSLYTMETRKCYTLNKEDLASNEHSEARILNRFRHHWRWMAQLGDKVPPEQKKAGPRPIESMTEEERVKEEDRMSKEASKLGPDPFKTELAVCAYVRGYYLTAAARFVDVCSLHIISGLVPQIVDEVRNFYLDRHLGVLGGAADAVGMFQRLMDEDQATSDRRTSLKEDKARFERTIRSIERLEKADCHSIDVDDDIVI